MIIQIEIFHSDRIGSRSQCLLFDFHRVSLHDKPAYDVITEVINTSHVEKFVRTETCLLHKGMTSADVKPQQLHAFEPAFHRTPALVCWL